MKAKRLLLVAILLLGVGFASVSTILILNGDVTITTNDADFDVKFTKATSEEGATAAISPDGKIITFGTRNLITVGDKSILNFEVTNNSTMYDAEVSVSCVASGEEDKNSYYKITSSVKSPIVAKTKEAGKVEVELLKASAEDLSEPFSCTLTAKAKERTTKAEAITTIVGYAPKYFSVEAPTTSSTTDFTTLGKDLFIGLDEDGSQLSVCIRENMEVVCFKNDDYDSAVARIKEVLGANNCRSDWSYIECSDGHFTCGINSTRALGCTDLVNPYFCRITAEGTDGCN